MATVILTSTRVREVLEYQPDTGHFYRKVRTAQRHQVGDRADFLINSGGNSGYYRVSIDGQRYMAHRVAWLFVFGAWPEDDIDHIDGDKGNNRIANLRDVPNKVNRQNTRAARSDNSSGLLGAHKHRGKWRASVQHEGRMHRAGLFSSPEDAHRAYVELKRALHSGCTI